MIYLCPQCNKEYGSGDRSALRRICESCIEIDRQKALDKAKQEQEEAELLERQAREQEAARVKANRDWLESLIQTDEQPVKRSFTRFVKANLAVTETVNPEGKTIDMAPLKKDKK